MLYVSDNATPKRDKLLSKDVIVKNNFRRGAYLAVAPQIAQLQGYQDVLTQHLLNTKLLHSNRYVRELAAQALRRVSFYTPFNDLVVRIETLEQRTLNFESTVNATRHGALLGLSALIDTYERRARAASLNEDKDFTFSSELAQVFASKPFSNVPG